MIALYIIGLLLCFYLLAKICEEYFIKSLDILAKKMKLSPDVAGATLMAMGSSAPELFTSMIALMKAGSENVGAGTIVGSAIFNVLVIVGASAAVATAYLSWKPVLRDLLFYIFSILVLLFTFRDGRISAGEASIYVLLYASYILLLKYWNRFVPTEHHERYMHKIAKETTKMEHEATTCGPICQLEKGADCVLGFLLPDVDMYPKQYMRTFTLSILSIGAISWVLVELAVLLAHSLGVSEVIIALTILAAGTSIPDLLSSIIVAKQGRGGMAVSNAVGSNTFDILFGLGLPWLLYTLFTGSEVVVSTENLISSIFLLFATVIALLMLLAIQKFKIGKQSGYLLLLLYLLYLGYVHYTAYVPGAWNMETWLTAQLTSL